MAQSFQRFAEAYRRQAPAPRRDGGVLTASDLGEPRGGDLLQGDLVCQGAGTGASGALHRASRETWREKLSQAQSLQLREGRETVRRQQELIRLLFDVLDGRRQREEAEALRPAFLAPRPESAPRGTPEAEPTAEEAGAGGEEAASPGNGGPVAEEPPGAPEQPREEPEPAEAVCQRTEGEEPASEGAERHQRRRRRHQRARAGDPLQLVRRYCPALPESRAFRSAVLPRLEAGEPAVFVADPRQVLSRPRDFLVEEGRVQLLRDFGDACFFVLAPGASFAQIQATAFCSNVCLCVASADRVDLRGNQALQVVDCSCCGAVGRLRLECGRVVGEERVGHVVQ